jgi:hypothetical protein
MGDEAEPQDVLQQGGDDSGPGRFRLPSGRPSRAAAVLATATLVFGLAAGYAAGHRQPRASAAPGVSQSAAASAGPGVAFSFDPGVLVLTQDIGACSAQSGHQLELGVQLTNQSPAAVTLTTARAVLPASGLKQVAQHWTACGALPDTFVPDDVILLPGGSTWLTVTLQVSASCPAAYPVQFAVRYVTTGRPQTISLPGFPDLGSVPYSGCPAS